MKKNKYLLLLILGIILLQNFSLLSAQNEGGFEIQKEANEKSPDVNIAQGIPNTNFSLLSVPTLSGKLSVNVSLNYLANNTSSHQMIGDVGAGWDILAGFSVSRTVHFIVEDYKKNKGTDNIMYCTSNIYQYSIPGGSGKFVINYDNVKHELTTTQFKLSKEKILIEKNTDTLTYKIKSFTVIDENGLKYVFDKTDISYYARGSLGNNTKALYHNNFNISKILDEKNNVLVTYDYDTTTKNISQGSIPFNILRNKLTKITIQNMGVIDFMYAKSSTYPVDRDNYSLQKIMLKDPGGNVVQQAVFGYDFNLSFLSIQGRNAQGIKKYTFEYNNTNDGHRDPFGFMNQSSYCTFGEGRFYGPDAIYPPYAPYGSLSAVHLPTGGKVEYTYESNMLPGADGFKVEKIAEIPYNNTNTTPTTQYSFTLPAHKYQKLFFSSDMGMPISFGPVNPSPFSYEVMHPASNTLFELADYYDCGMKMMTPFTDGLQNYKLYIYGANQQGTMTMYGLLSESGPENYHPYKGLRIRSIKKYENDAADPSVWLDYNYDLFATPGTPSSEVYIPTDSQGSIGFDVFDFSERIVYTNVKVTDLVKNYSTRYTFAKPSEIETMFNIPPSVMELTDFNSSLKNGTLLLTEQYDHTNKLIYRQEFTYMMDTKANPDNINASAIPWIKNQGIIGKTYMDNNVVLTNTSLLTYEPEFGNLTSDTNTDQGGDVTEKTYQYAYELNNQKLLNANLSGIPLIQESKMTKNGITKTLSKSEVKFDDPTHTLPTSSVSYNVISGTPETDATLDRYDNYGNLLQTTSKSGIPTTLVYGYNNTQIIAKVEGITYDVLQNLNLIVPIVSASNEDAADPSKETALITALDTFRKNQGLKNYYITTYTYDPLIGLTSETSSLGIRKKYVYDNANSLIKVTDINGVTLEEYKSNIKQH